MRSLPVRRPHRRLNRRQFLQTSAAAFSGLALSSCGWRLGSATPTAPTNGDTSRLYVYTWAFYTDQELLNNFELETGVKAAVDVFDSNELMLATMQTGRGDDYSVVYPSDYMVTEMVDLGLLQELDPSRLPVLEDLFPQFKDPKYDPGNRHSVPISWGTTGFVYNEKELEEAPVDWSYVWEHQDKLKRRMTLLNDSREVMGGVLRMLGYSYNPDTVDQVREAYERLQELKPAIASFTTDAWRNQIITGDLLLAMCYSSDAVEVMQENPDLKYVVPASGSSLWVDTMAILKSAPNPDSAHDWIDFNLRPSVASRMSNQWVFATVTAPAFEELPKEFRENELLYPPQDVVDRCEGITPVSDEVEAAFEDYWSQLTSG